MLKHELTILLARTTRIREMPEHFTSGSGIMYAQMFVLQSKETSIWVIFVPICTVAFRCDSRYGATD